MWCGKEDRALLWRVPAAMPEAAAARLRFRQEKPLGPLDGVPLAVKDCIDVAALFEVLADTRLDCDAVPARAPTPSAPACAPKAHKSGELDTDGIARLAAVAFPANLTGLPSCAVPCVRDGLPTGTADPRAPRRRVARPGRRPPRRGGLRSAQTPEVVWRVTIGLPAAGPPKRQHEWPRSSSWMSERPTSRGTSWQTTTRDGALARSRYGGARQQPLPRGVDWRCIS